MSTVLALLVALNTSCKKNYTCSCTTTSSVPGMVPYKTTRSTGKMTEKKAEATCKEGESTLSVTEPNTGLSILSVTSCDLQ